MFNLGFIGGGNMSSAVGHSVMKNNIHDPSKVWVSGPRLCNLTKWKELGANVTTNNAEVVQQCDVIFLGVKPNMLTTAIEDITSGARGKESKNPKVFVSMLAGVKIERLVKVLLAVTESPLVIRTMPNTPMLVQEGVCLYTPGPGVTQEQCTAVEALLLACGVVQQVKEEMIDSFGALTGCGPAFMYLVMEALSDGAVKQGVPRALATRFAAQMMLGSARMVLATGRHPGALKDEVCSPGGSTICGVAQLEQDCVRSAFIKAVEASAKRNTELGKN